LAAQAKNRIACPSGAGSKNPQVEKKDIILIGNPGVGKSFLAKTVAYAATQQGFKVLFTTAMDMINITTNLPFADWATIFDSTWG
jgi:DNA replication protein DnaC